MTSIDAIKAVISDVAPHYDVQKIALFGSYAKGKSTSSSDIDIVLDTGKDFSLLDAIRLQEELSRELKAEVDVVSRAALYEPIAKSILESQVLLYER